MPSPPKVSLNANIISVYEAAVILTGNQLSLDLYTQSEEQLCSVVKWQAAELVSHR